MTWVAFSERWPEKVCASDNPEIKCFPKVLVTNNLAARDRMGQMSHIWLAVPFEASNPHLTGAVVAFDEGDRRIENLTHWLDLAL